MDYALAYESSHSFSWPGLISGLIPFAFAILGTVILYRGIRKKLRWHAYILPSLWLLVSLVACVVLVFQFSVTKPAVYDRYVRGDFRSAEGPVERFHPMPEDGHSSESFYVDGVFFRYPDQTGWGYGQYMKDGGAIVGNGQNVRIGYVTYLDENIIMRLEVMPAPQCQIY